MNATTRPILRVEDNPMDVDLTRRPFARRKVCNPIEVCWNVVNEPPRVP